MANLRIVHTEELSEKAQALQSSLNLTWSSPRYEEHHILRHQLGKIQMPVIIQNHAIGELEVGKYFSPDGTFLETFFFVEQLKYALEQVLAS